MKAYLALRNKTMKKFLKQTDILEISENLTNYDIMFCDTLKLGKEIKAKIKVYLACNYFESLENLILYEEYDYFIGFGSSDLYDFLYDKYDLSSSKIFDGFVSTKDDIPCNPEIETICSYLDQNYNDESDIYKISQKGVKRFFNIIKDTDYHIIHNHPFPNNLMNINKLHWTDDMTLSQLKNSLIIFTDSLSNCRLFFNEKVLQKTILMCKNYDQINYHINYHINNNNITKNLFIFNNVKIEISEFLVSFDHIYKQFFGKSEFTSNKINQYVFEKSKKYLYNQPINKRNKFLLYDYEFSTEKIKNICPINTGNIDLVFLYKLMSNVNNISNKNNKIIEINNVSEEFTQVIQGIIS